MAHKERIVDLISLSSYRCTSEFTCIVAIAFPSAWLWNQYLLPFLISWRICKRCSTILDCGCPILQLFAVQFYMIIWSRIWSGSVAEFTDMNRALQVGLQFLEFEEKRIVKVGLRGLLLIALLLSTFSLESWQVCTCLTRVSATSVSPLFCSRSS